MRHLDAIAILPSAEDPGTVFHWQHLESLTSIGYPKEEEEEEEEKEEKEEKEEEKEAFINNLANCLRRRQEAGLSKLRLTFPVPFSVERFLFVYEQLNDLCILECAYNTHDITLSGVTSSKPWLPTLHFGCPPGRRDGGMHSNKRKGLIVVAPLYVARVS
ncbi:hypothetical protein M404DRAFT_24267 [Pisolithus tinctorius Marx 270]|uniref:Uncharacterized protein n=1 Tax=Pisolithus tinctorius Marx 270 TaxID=870435 RepID=A0A0C3KC29_PISTI|nr:hypothetical protein M404DRAFT_24267 [Pisolithus tinctorius Marx 270]